MTTHPARSFVTLLPAVVAMCSLALVGCVQPYDPVFTTPVERLQSRMDGIDLARQDARRNGLPLDGFEREARLVRDTLQMLQSGAIAPESVATLATAGTAPEDIGAPHRDAFYESPINIAVLAIAFIALVLGTLALIGKRHADKPHRGLITRRRMRVQEPRTSARLLAATGSPGEQTADGREPMYRRIKAISDSQTAPLPPKAAPVAPPAPKPKPQIRPRGDQKAGDDVEPPKQSAGPRPNARPVQQDIPAETPSPEPTPTPHARPPAKRRAPAASQQADEPALENGESAGDVSVEDIRSRVARAAGRGLDPAEIAAELGISLDHVRLILRVSGK
jgi:hypothetical protein